MKPNSDFGFSGSLPSKDEKVAYFLLGAATVQMSTLKMLKPNKNWGSYHRVLLETIEQMRAELRHGAYNRTAPSDLANHLQKTIADKMKGVSDV